MRVGEILGTALDFVPIVRSVASIVVGIVRIVSASVSEVEAQIKEIEAINRWLKDNSVNTFTEYYDKNFKEK